MTKNEEFDKDFDFEKEYGFDPKSLLDPEYDSDEALKNGFDASFDEDFIKDFDAKFSADLDEKFAAEFGEEFAKPAQEEPAAAVEFQDEVLEEDEDSLIPDFVNTEFPSEYAASANEATRVLPAFDLPEFDEKVIDQSVFEDAASEAEEMPAAEAAQTDEPTQVISMDNPTPPARPRRRKLSRERLIKEVYLPPAIAGLTALLCLIFIIGGIGRAIKGNPDKPGKEDSSATGVDAQTQLQLEAAQLLGEAKALAAGYDYQGALDKLNSFSDKDNMDKYPELITARSEYATMKDQVQAWNEPSSITNLSLSERASIPIRRTISSSSASSCKTVLTNNLKEL